MFESLSTQIIDKSLALAILVGVVGFLIQQLRSKDQQIKSLSATSTRAVDVLAVQNEVSRQAAEGFKELSRRIELLERSVSGRNSNG